MKMEPKGRTPIREVNRGQLNGGGRGGGGNEYLEDAAHVSALKEVVNGVKVNIKCRRSARKERGPLPAIVLQEEGGEGGEGGREGGGGW